MPRYEHRSNATAAWRYYLHTRDSLAAIRRFGLNRAVYSKPLSPLRWKSQGSFNYDMESHVILGDHAFFIGLHEMMKERGLHFKEFGGIYDIYHDQAWLGAWSLWGLEEAREVLRASLAVTALCSMPEALKSTALVLADGEAVYNNHPVSAPISMAFPGQRAVSRDAAIKGKFTGQTARVDLLVYLTMASGQAIRINKMKPYLLGPPDDNGMVKRSDGTTIPFNDHNNGPWHMDGWRLDIFNSPIRSGEAVVLRMAMDGDREAARMVAEWITFPYQGYVAGTRHRNWVSAASFRRLNSNKPPVDAALLTKGGDWQGVCGGGDPNKKGWGTGTPGAKEVTVDGADWVVTTVLDQKVRLHGSPDCEDLLWDWSWGVFGFDFSANLDTTEPAKPEPQPEKESWWRRLLQKLFSLF